ncbi:MAG TPA: hypothetical protein VLS28_09720 [Candidatus Sulfomarinibacteraceae bacterium]|nr:hypothetical protein [Candidatus Sulfomarinibacteraceae bacterium]
MSRSVPGVFGGLRPRRSLPRAVALVVMVAIVTACSSTAPEPTFSLSIRNSGDAPLRLKVLAGTEGGPPRALLIPARSGVLETEPGPMRVREGKPEPVVVEVYTDTCALLASLSVGEGRTQIVIDGNLAITTTPGVPDVSGAVEPGLAATC